MQSKVECKQKAKNKQRLDPSVHLFCLFFYNYFMSRLAELRGHKCNQRAQFPHDKVVTKCSATPSEAYRYDRTHNFDNALQILFVFLEVHTCSICTRSPRVRCFTQGTWHTNRRNSSATTRALSWSSNKERRCHGGDVFFAIFISPCLQPITRSEHSGVVIQIWCRYPQCLCRWLTWILSHVVAGP